MQLNEAKVELIAVTPNAELVIENAGRTCYESFDKVSEGSHVKLIKHLIKNGHTSVLEHATVTFRLADISRSLSHQLVRHRIASYSQKSQRYVKESDFDYIVPDAVAKDSILLEKYNDIMKFIEDGYADLVKSGIRKEDARYLLPNACSTEIVVSFNFRSLFNFFDQRGDIHAQWEIRRVAIQVLEFMKDIAPTVFEHYKIDYVKEIIYKEF